MVTADEIQESLSRRFTLTPHGGARLGAPAELFTVDGGPATVGIIASVTRPFCGDCDRTRLTADGQVRTCLFARSETDLRAMLRGGASDDEIAARLADRDLGQAARARHRRPVVPAARSADERHRWLSRLGAGPAGRALTSPTAVRVAVRYFAAAGRPPGSTEEQLECRLVGRWVHASVTCWPAAAVGPCTGRRWPRCCDALQLPAGRDRRARPADTGPGGSGPRCPAAVRRRLTRGGRGTQSTAGSHHRTE